MASKFLISIEVYEWRSTTYPKSRPIRGGHGIDGSLTGSIGVTRRRRRRIPNKFSSEWIDPLDHRSGGADPHDGFRGLPCLQAQANDLIDPL